MDLDSLTLGQVKQLRDFTMPSAKSNGPYIVGEKYLIRTITMIYTGRLTAVYDQELVIENAAWIPETDRWEQTCKEGKLKEVEPYADGEIIIGRGAILDVSKWTKELPREQK